MAEPGVFRSKIRVIILAIIGLLLCGLWYYLRYMRPSRSSVLYAPELTDIASPAWARNDVAVRIESLPANSYRIINDHEHLLDEQEARRVLQYMDELGIDKTVLLGTSLYTLTLSNKYGFEGYKDNNLEILRLAKKWPDRFLAFPTIYPPDPNNLELLKEYAAQGAAGFKLYLGHGASTGKEPFHMMPLDDPRMLPIYQWAQSVQLPIQFHVNLTKYYEEFVRVMEKFPCLRVCIPHFGLCMRKPERLAVLGKLFDRYPNLYSDVSFGFYTFQVDGFQVFDRNPGLYRDFLIRYADRFMYSTDMVVERNKDNAYIQNTLRSYRQMLEMEWYRFFLAPGWLWRGLNLPPEALHKIYEKTPARYLLLDAKGHPPDRSKP